jgi:hypothetical protein
MVEVQALCFYAVMVKAKCWHIYECIKNRQMKSWKSLNFCIFQYQYTYRCIVSDCGIFSPHYSGIRILFRSVGVVHFAPTTLFFKFL